MGMGNKKATNPTTKASEINNNKNRRRKDIQKPLCMFQYFHFRFLFVVVIFISRVVRQRSMIVLLVCVIYTIRESHTQAQREMDDGCVVIDSNDTENATYDDGFHLEKGVK